MDAKDYALAAHRALREAQALAGNEPMSDEEFLTSMATPPIQEHDLDTCGMCTHRWIMHEVAKPMLEVKDFTNGMQRWAEESERLWQATKFVKAYQDAVAAGKDPHVVFNELGWQL